MAKSNLGKTVIDELRLCFVAEAALLEDLRNIRHGEWWNVNDFSLQRVECRYFGVGFNVYMNHDAEHVASIKFDRYGEAEDSVYIYYKIENHVLYKPEKFQTVMMLPDYLGLSLNNITALDLAQDFRKNICNAIRRTYKDETITTIINGKAVKDRKMIQDNMSIIYAVTLDKLKNPSLYIKQAKALHDKTKGVTVCAYDKAAEIRNTSDKQYVLDYYSNPKRLHRLEVRLNSGEIRDYCAGRGIVQSADLLFDQEFLTNIYMYHLSSVLRFTKGRDKISWNDIL